MVHTDLPVNRRSFGPHHRNSGDEQAAKYGCTLEQCLEPLRGVAFQPAESVRDQGANDAIVFRAVLVLMGNGDGIAEGKYGGQHEYGQ